MCGVVGYIGLTTRQVDEAFTDLLYMDVIRGKDSTGVASVSTNNRITVEKAPGFPWDLEQGGGLKRALQSANRVLMGHNRAATRGDVNYNNAHPFWHDHIVGVHNGTLVSERGLANPYAFGTDSEALINSIALEGIDETYANLDGAATLIYYDSKEQTLNMITNGKRPLFFAQLEKGNGLFWASERWMLVAIQDRYKDITFEGIKYPNSHNLFTFYWEKNKVEYKWRKLEPFVPLVYYNRGYGHNGYRGYSGPAQVIKQKTEQERIDKAKKEAEEKKGRDKKFTSPPKNQGKFVFNGETPKKDKQIIEDLDLDNPIRIEDGIIRRKVGDYGNTWVTREEFESRMSSCCFCGDPITFNDLDVDIFDEYSAACGECCSLYTLSGINPLFAKN